MRVTREFAKLHCRHVDVNVDSIQQWSGYSSYVSLNLDRRATTLTRGVIPKPTRAWVHGGCQHECGRKRQRHCRATDRHLLIFKWLAQHFQHTAIKFR